MIDIKIEVTIEPGTSEELIQKGNRYVNSIRTILQPIAFEIMHSGAYLTLKQSKNGNFSVQAHGNNKEVLDRLEQLIATVLPST